MGLDSDGSNFLIIFSTELPPCKEQEITPERYVVFGLSLLGVLIALILLEANAYTRAGIAALTRKQLEKLAEQNPGLGAITKDLLQLSNVMRTADIFCYIIAPASAISAIHQFNIYNFWVSLMVFALICIILLFTRAIPRGFAIRTPERAANRSIKLLRFEMWLFAPIANFIVNIGAKVVTKKYPTEDRKKLKANIGDEFGFVHLTETEQTIATPRFGDRTAHDIMIPRLDMIAVPSDCSLDRLLEIIQNSGFSRLPVYRNSIDQIIGILYAKDLLACVRDSSNFSLMRMLRPAYFVPESKRADTLFSELQNKRVHIAIVVDEYGGTAGLVTIENLLEEIVGEIHDEYDQVNAGFVRLNLDEIIVDSRMKLEEVNQFFLTRWESDAVDTIGGLVYEILGRVPEPGNEIILDRSGNSKDVNAELEAGDIAIIVMSVSGQRLRQLRLIHNNPA
ncbi:hemolysin family protein [Candidatus Chlorohelix sp.]|uniref:hemolysin family protein n=1 Tax=Candidatus Chlorohelix sp. TaxID=3139201 RepID=UPI00306D91E1